MPRRPRPLCAICADREATTITDWECDSGATRTVVACWPCLSPVPDPPEDEPDDLAERMRPVDVAARTSRTSGTRAAVLAAVRRIGRATAREVVAELGAVDNAALTNLIRQHLSRLTACGALELDRSETWRASDPGVYRATGGAETRTMADSASTFAALPEEFSTFDVAPDDHRKAAGIVRTWRREGLISCVRAMHETSAKGQRALVPAVWRKTGRQIARAA